MGLNFQYTEGQTPLTEEEKEGLLIKSINTREELDEQEQFNIEKAIEWIIKSRFRKDNILTAEFIKTVHKKMFGNTWKWAGNFRKSEKNIGVDWIKIEVDLKILLDDTKFWIDHNTFSPDEIAIRFKHRLVSIHCFANGNGRHSRIMADIIIESIFEKEIFRWGNLNLSKADEIRKMYITSLQKADQGEIGPLILFARGE